MQLIVLRAINSVKDFFYGCTKTQYRKRLETHFSHVVVLNKYKSKNKFFFIIFYKLSMFIDTFFF